jgi:hypothetical protein
MLGISFNPDQAWLDGCRRTAPKLVRELGEGLYPEASTDTWVRHVVTPVRSVINNAR